MKIGFIGLGNVGGKLAASLLRNKFDLIVRDLDKNLLKLCSKLKIVSNVAVGVDNIDIHACTQMGVQVTNTPGVLNDAVADMSMALLLSVARRVPEGDKMVRAGNFKGNPYPLLWGADLKGENLGIIGMGSIGQDVAKRAIHS